MAVQIPEHPGLPEEPNKREPEKLELDKQEPDKQEPDKQEPDKQEPDKLGPGKQVLQGQRNCGWLQQLAVTATD